jgi:hypothetical protein
MVRPLEPTKGEEEVDAWHELSWLLIERDDEETAIPLQGSDAS